MSVHVNPLLGQTDGERKAFIGGYKKGNHIVRFEIILPLLCCLLDPLRNKHYREWSSVINLWINSRNCQNYRILLLTMERSNNYLELPKENVLGNMMLSHWPSSTWNFFMIWFHKILKLIYQKQSSCPRNMCTEHWRNHLLSQLSRTFSYTLRRTIL